MKLLGCWTPKPVPGNLIAALSLRSGKWVLLSMAAQNSDSELLYLKIPGSCWKIIQCW